MVLFVFLAQGVHVVQGHHVIHYFFRFDKQVGKAEFLGRAIGKPNAILFEEDYKAPSLEWFQIHRGSEDAGELLAAFEMFEVGFSTKLNYSRTETRFIELQLSENEDQDLPPFPDAKDLSSQVIFSSIN